jgi:hypothetical protein
MTRIPHLAAATIVLALLSAGCDGGAFTRSAFDTIYVGQPRYDVRRKLGEPTHRLDDAWLYVHEAPFRKAIVRFEDDRVVSKEWSYDRGRDFAADAQPGR